MSKFFKSMGMLALMSVVWILSSAFTQSPFSEDGDNSCVVSVRYSDGTPASYVEITTEVSGGMFCIGGREFKADSDGNVVLKWIDDCYLRKVYAKGKGYKVDYKNGGSYSLTISRE